MDNSVHVITLTLSGEALAYLRSHLEKDTKAYAIYLAAVLTTDLGAREVLGLLRAAGHCPESVGPQKEEDKTLDDWYAHREFYGQAIKQANRILREAAKGQDGGEQ